MITATDELNRFITSILELNKVESKRLQLNFESKDINVLLERAIDSFRAQALANKIKLSANLEPLFPIRVDASLISKIINNLIDNAIKYSPPNSEIRISSRETGDWIEIAITDQGIGMSREERELLFTRFFRIKNEATTKVAGTGLGLYLTKYFVEAHKGTVEVESEKGLGSTFKIRLPLKANFPKENAHV
jgi:signal transduction histidine kinase